MSRARARRPGLIAACCAVAFLGAGCAAQVTEELTVVDADKIRVRAEEHIPTTQAQIDDDMFEVTGDWRRSLEPFEGHEVVLASTGKPDGEQASPAPEPKPPSTIERLVARSDPKPTPRPRVAAPRPRSARPRRPKGEKAVKSPERLARDHYLDYPTRIVAQRITFYCPADCAREIRIKADDVRQTHPTRRMARGNARVICRELTLEADRITVRIRDGEEQDLQVSARGNVTLVSTVRKQETREEGLRSLLITNDRLVPLR